MKHLALRYNFHHFVYYQMIFKELTRDLSIIGEIIDQNEILDYIEILGEDIKTMNDEEQKHDESSSSIQIIRVYRSKDQIQAPSRNNSDEDNNKQQRIHHSDEGKQHKKESSDNKQNDESYSEEQYNDNDDTEY